MLIPSVVAVGAGTFGKRGTSWKKKPFRQSLEDPC